MAESSFGGDAVRGSGKKNRRLVPVGQAPWLTLSLSGALLCAVAASCVTQTRSDAQGAQWQPGATPGPAAKSRAPRPGGNKPSPGSTASTNQGAGASSGTPAEQSAEPSTEPKLGQLQLLTPQDPAADGQIDRAPNPIQRKPAEPPSRGPIANPPRVRQFYSYSATFAAGRCRFASCDKNGWNTPHAEGESESRCHDNSCLTRGWTTTHPDGTSVETRCNAGSCTEHGWSTANQDSPTARPNILTPQTHCLPAGCFTGGWLTSYPDDTVAETHCHNKSCLQSGWTTRLPSGDTIECRCQQQDCAKNGAECT